MARGFQFQCESGHAFVAGPLRAVFGDAQTDADDHDRDSHGGVKTAVVNNAEVIELPAGFDPMRDALPTMSMPLPGAAPTPTPPPVFIGGGAVARGPAPKPVAPRPNDPPPAIAQLEVLRSESNNELGGQTSFFLHNKSTDRVISATYEAEGRSFGAKGLFPGEKRFAWVVGGHPINDAIRIVGAFYGN